MEKLTNKEFINFLEYYNGFLKPVSEISKNSKGNSLIEDDLKLYYLDDIIFSNMKYSEYDYPKSTDSLYFKSENGKLSLYLIEFKFMNLLDSRRNAEILFNQFKNEFNRNQFFTDELLESFMNVIEFEFEFADIEDYEVIARQLFDRFKMGYEKNQNFNDDFFKYYQRIINNHVDADLINIIFKVIETLTIVLPELYEKYCMDNDFPIKNIREFLRGIEKNFVLIFGSGNMNRANLRLQSNNLFLDMQLKNLVRGKIIDDFKIMSHMEFNFFKDYFIK